MTSLPTPFDPYNPIPNNPFYSPASFFLAGPLGPVIVGSGLSVSVDGVISSTGGGSGGTVTSITAGTGLSGGNITGSGTIAIANTGVVAGAYTFPALSVNAQGQITTINSGFPVLTVTANAPLSVAGTVQQPILSVAAASITAVGVTQLNNTTSSTLTNQALTAAAGKNLQDQINSIAQGSGSLILAGTLNCTTGNVVTATTAGTTAGILAGAPVPAATPALNDYYLVVTTAAASYTPTGGTAIANVNVGDYIICSSGVWTILRVGPITGAYATTTTAGVVELATGAEVIAGVNPNVVLTPSTAAGAYVPKNVITSKGQLIVGTSAGSFTALPVGVDGFVATADSSCPSGIKWAAPAGGGSGSVSITGLGAIFVTPSPITGIGAIGINNASTAAVGAVQLADVAATQAGVSTALAVTPAGGAASYFLTCTIAAKGDLVVGCANDCAVVLPVGANGQALIACSTCNQGITWGSPSVPATPTTLGSMYGVPCDALVNASFGCGTLASITTGTGNTAGGRGALQSLATGSCNVALGSANLSVEASGSQNTAIGTGALCAQNGASDNTAIGFGVGNSISTGANNTALGSCAADSLTTGACNTFIGKNAAGALTTGNNNIVIGYNAVASAVGVNNEVTVGNSSNSSYRIYAASWTNVSDGRDKKDVEELALGLDFVTSLQPVKYVWNYRDGSAQNGNTDIGFIAQDLLKAQTDANAAYAGFVNESNPEQLAIAQSKLIPVLVNAVKELAAEVAELKAKLK